MQRRNFIKSFTTGVLLSGLAGCSEMSNESQSNKTTKSTKRPTNSTTTKNSYNSMISTPNELPLNYSVESVHSKFNSEKQPVTIKITIENPTEYEYFYSDERQAFFYLEQSQNTPYQIFPKENIKDDFTYTSLCWKTTKSYEYKLYNKIKSISPKSTQSRELVIAVSEFAQCPSVQDEILFNTVIRTSKEMWSQNTSAYNIVLSLNSIDGATSTNYL